MTSFGTKHPTSSTTEFRTAERSTAEKSASRYAVHVSWLLLAAFALSAAYTVWTTVTGVAHDPFTAKHPAAWAFYVGMFAAAAFVRTDRRAAWWLLAGLLPLLLGVGIFVYPTTFTTDQQTPLGWFENDVYLGLLMVAGYLTVQRLRNRRIAP